MEKESQKVKKVNLQELRKETNDYEVWDEEKQVWCDYKSSCYSVVVRQAGFPTPDKAQHPILSIACKVLGSRDPFVVFGTRVNTKDEYFNYIHCDSEEKMLQAFQTYWVSEVNPDIVTGWNCIPVAESIWLNDRIAKLKDVAPKQHLVDSFVHHVFPRSIKPTATIRLKNGHQFFCSKEHRFPIATLPARTYTDPVNSNFIRDDLSAEAIKTLLSTNSVYLRQEIHKNTAEPLTYRRLIVDNLDLLCSKGMEIVIRDNEIVKKMTAATGEPCWEKKRHTEWTVGRVSSALSRKEVIRFIKRSATLDVYAPEIGRSLKTVDLDSVISLDDLWTMGLWYTDGTQSYKTEVSICNKDERIAEKTKDILNKYRRTSTKTIKRHSDGCYYIKAGLTNVWFWKLFFYENVKSCSQKQIDVTLLSQLDKQQFMAFMAGCIDGDGSVSKTGLISLVNYNNDIRHFSELLNWNGIFTTIFASGKTLTFYDDSIENFLIHPVKKTNAQSSKGSMRERSSKSNCLAWNINDDHAWVRVESVDLEGDLAEMVDISTDTHYFVSQGIRTHNCEQFDIPYIINRCNKVMGEEFTKKFSPFNGIIKNPITSHIPHSKKKKSGEEKEKDLIYEITGITVVDYLPLYKKYSMATLESYRLDVVAKHELGMGKVDYSQYDGLMGLYEKNFELFLYYNYMDVKIIEDLESKLNFLFLVATVTYLGKSKYEDAFGVVKWWDTYIYNELLKKNVQIPPHRRRGIDDTKIVGGFVKEPVPKMYSWIATLDLASLYPSIIMSFNLSPEKAYKSAIYDLNEIESLVDMKNDLTWIRDADVAMLANGATFRRDGQGILPELVDGMFSSRKEYKKQMLDATSDLESLKNSGASPDEIKSKEAEVATYSARQQAYKISLNSLYGATANASFRYNSRDIAEGITTTGQLVIRYISKRINARLNELFKTKDVDYIIFNDTDSAGLNLEYIVNQMFPVDQSANTLKIVNFLDKFVKTYVTPHIAKEFQALSDYLNAFQNRLSMNREVIADRGIWRGKKHYILQVWDKEGLRYKAPKLKMMGIETAKSSTPQIVRGSLEQALKVILNGKEEELQAFVKKFKEDFYSAPIADIAFPRGVSDMDKWIDGDGLLTKGVPIHVRGCVVYNRMLENAKTGEYPKIKNGDKIKFVYLKVPNISRSHVIAFLDVLPPEFGLNEFVDKETQFSKTFLEPLRTFAEIVGWNTEKTITLDAFFE